MKNRSLAGVDYDSKLAGTSVLAYSPDRQHVHFLASRKGEDADAFLFRHLLELRPQRILLDAPLSLPGVYAKLPGYKDYFFRKADRELKAMSPMFLGGLTARAMQLKERLSGEDIHCQEGYPAALAYHFGLIDKGYKKDKKLISRFMEELIGKYHLKIETEQPLSWHIFDSLLALISAFRVENQEVDIWGSEEEGIICV